MPPIAKPIPEWRDVDPERLRTRILASGRPAVMRGFAAHWPAVSLGLESARALGRHLLETYCGVPVPLFEVAAEENGRIFYDATLTGFNFKSRRAPLDEIIERLVALASDPAPPTLYSGSVSIPIYLPGFAARNRLDGLPTVSARLDSIWIGNRSRVAPHFDASENVACVVAGRRRFTLFPPDQIANLYVGPIDRTPAGQPISLVDPRRPDLERFPRYAEALAHAETAVLEPGDAIYVPTLWWHGVEALEPFNVLVNTWWQDTPDHFESPLQSLTHCLLSIKNLPLAQRKSWKALFDYLIFQEDGPALEHLPPPVRGAFGALSADTAAMLRAQLLERLSRR